MVIFCRQQDVSHMQNSQGLGQTEKTRTTDACVSLCLCIQALTSIVVIVRVVLKRVSVTLIDGRVLSMDSPSSECHRPIYKPTHTRIQTKNQSPSPSAGKGQQKQSVLNFLPSHYRRIGVTFRQGGRSLRCEARRQGNSERNAGGNENNVLGSWRHVHRACVQSEATECIH